MWIADWPLGHLLVRLKPVPILTGMIIKQTGLANWSCADVYNNIISSCRVISWDTVSADKSNKNRSCKQLYFMEIYISLFIGSNKIMHISATIVNVNCYVLSLLYALMFYA